MAILFLNLYERDFIFHYDSFGYWSHSSEFIKGGVFSFRHYDFPLRAYLFPFFILVIQDISQMAGILSFVGFEVVISLFYSSLLTLVVPEVVYLLYQKEIGVLPILVFNLFALYFWQGYFFYPLTDLPAFFLVLLGVYVLIKFHKSWWLGFWTGCAWGSAILLRPSYQISLLPLLLWAAYFFYYEIHVGLQKITVRILTILAGMSLVFGPQIDINFHNYGIFSAFPQTQIFYKGNDLFSTQLGWGLNIQKYETNIGANYPIAQVRFLDPHGESILIRDGYKSKPYAQSGEIGPDSPLKFGDYARLISKYPLDFLGIYARHFFNGLDIRYDTVYISDIYRNNYFFRLTNYTIWFLALAYLTRKVWKRKLSGLNSRIFLPIIFALPALLSIPTAIEVRFMLPFYFMAYALAAFWVLPEFFALDMFRKKKVILKYLLWYGCFIILCFMFSASTYTHLEYGS